MPLGRGGGTGAAAVRVEVEMHAAPGDQAAEAMLAVLRPHISRRFGGNVDLAMAGR